MTRVEFLQMSLGALPVANASLGWSVSLAREVLSIFADPRTLLILSGGAIISSVAVIRSKFRDIRESRSFDERMAVRLDEFRSHEGIPHS